MSGGQHQVSFCTNFHLIPETGCSLFDYIFWPWCTWDPTVLVLMFVQQTLYTFVLNLCCCVKTPCKRERGFWEKVYSSSQLQTEPQWWKAWHQAAGAGSWSHLFTSTQEAERGSRKQSEDIGPQSPLPSDIASSNKALPLKGFIISPNGATNRGPSVQMEDIALSDHDVHWAIFPTKCLWVLTSMKYIWLTTCDNLTWFYP